MNAIGSVALQAVLDANPHRRPRLVLRTTVVLVAIAALWVTFGRLDVVAVADGRVVPQSYVKVVQPSEGGVVREILVAEGDTVRKGQVLIRMDATVSGADRDALEGQLILHQLALARIDAELAGRSTLPASALKGLHAQQLSSVLPQVEAQLLARRQEQLDILAREVATVEQARQELLAAEHGLNKLEQTLPSYQRAEQSYADLKDKGFVSEIAASEKSRDALEKAQDLKTQSATVLSLKSTLAAAQRHQNQSESSYRASLQNERTDHMSAIAKISGDLAKENFRNSQLDLVASDGGVVKDISVSTIGAVVQPGATVLTIVPLGVALVVEASVDNADIGFVHRGARAIVKLDAYPYQRYGAIDGVVALIQADSREDRSGKNGPMVDGTPQGAAQSTAYKSIIELDSQTVSTASERLDIQPGMRAKVEINEGSRTVLSYFVDGSVRASEALHER